MSQDLFHSGELFMQQQLNVQHIAAKVGNTINNKIIGGAIAFIEKTPTLVLSSTNANNEISCSLIVGHYGFLKVHNADQIEINLEALQSPIEDTFFENIKTNPSVGCIFIEFSSQRRYRINGMASYQENRIILKVTEAYPNCPKYIQKRILDIPVNTKNNANITFGKPMTPAMIDTIRNADTFFIGSSDGDLKSDASHRGGQAGFIEILNNQTLRIPDYIGNNLFNTLGNLIKNPNCGLLFIDFKNQQTIQLQGKAKITFPKNGITPPKGTLLYWTFEIDNWIVINKHNNIEWEFIAYSKFNPKTEA